MPTMKTRWSWIAVLAGAGLLGAPTGLQGQEARLVAPAPAGAVPRGAEGEFLARATMADVRGFYDGRYGPARADGDGWRGPGAVAELDGALYWEVISFDESRVITGEPLNEAMQTTAAGVTLEGPLPDPEAGDPEPRVVGPYYRELRTIVRAGAAMPEVERPATASDIAPILRKYRHLATLHFPVVQTEEGQVPFPEVHFDRCEERLRSPAADVMSEEERQAAATRLQELYMLGKFEEAQRLTERIAGTATIAGGRDRLLAALSLEGVKHWEGCLTELAEEGYPLLVRISTHPETWELQRWWDRRGES